MWRWGVAALLLGAVAGQGKAGEGHRTGFTPYGQVDRPDGTHREMLVESAALAALRLGEGFAEGGVILMESHLPTGGIGSIFAKRREGGGWAYGTFRPGETMAAFRPSGACAGCHRAAEATGGSFTRPMLEAFVATGEVQRRRCERSGRAPCGPEVYGGR